MPTNKVVSCGTIDSMGPSTYSQHGVGGDACVVAVVTPDNDDDDDDSDSSRRNWG